MNPAWGMQVMYLGKFAGPVLLITTKCFTSIYDHINILGVVYEHVLGENKFTFVEECKNPRSVTILMKGPNKHTLSQMKVSTEGP